MWLGVRGSDGSQKIREKCDLKFTFTLRYACGRALLVLTLASDITDVLLKVLLSVMWSRNTVNIILFTV